MLFKMESLFILKMFFWSQWLAGFEVDIVPGEESKVSEIVRDIIREVDEGIAGLHILPEDLDFTCFKRDGNCQDISLSWHE